jgi:hypothetical protein
VVEFTNKEVYNVQYLADNKLSVKPMLPEEGDAVIYTLDNSDPALLQVFAIQNFGDNLQTKIGSTQQDGQQAPTLDC